MRTSSSSPSTRLQCQAKKENAKLNRMRIIVWLRFGGIQSHNNKSNRLHRLIRGVVAAARGKIAIHFCFCCKRPGDQLPLVNKYWKSTHYLYCGRWCFCSTAVTVGAHRVYISFIPFRSFIYIRHIYFSFIYVCSDLFSWCSLARLPRPGRSAVADTEFPVEWFGFWLVVNCA